ncbi:MAG TPA: hypothetical protein VF371_09130 [Candidatus Limnocylindrales bacterium]
MFGRRDRDSKDEDPAGDAPAGQTPAGEELDGDELDDLAEDMTADLDSQAAEYFADNDVWMYGPNATAVLEILDWLEEIVPSEARPLAETWLAIPKSDRDRARKAARKIAEDDLEMGRHLQLAREAVTTWMSVAAAYPDFVSAEPDWARLCGQVAEAALDAATAVILEGKLEEGHYEALLEPWSETTAQLDAAAEAASLDGGDSELEEELDEEGDDDVVEGEFGPNSNEVVDFMNRLWLLAPEQIGRLVTGWQDAARDELKIAHEAIQEIADENPECREQVRAAQEKLAPWLNSGRVAETPGILGQTGQGYMRKMAGPALADAMAALVLGDLLEPADAETLYAPWYNIMGAPELPESLPVKKVDKAPATKSAKPAKRTKPAKTADAPKSKKKAKKK